MIKRGSCKCPQCHCTYVFKQGLNQHWKGVHGSLDTLVASSCNRVGKMSSKEDKVSRFTCPFDGCDRVAFTNVLQLSSHCKSDHDTYSGAGKDGWPLF